MENASKSNSSNTQHIVIIHSGKTQKSNKLSKLKKIMQKLKSIFFLSLIGISTLSFYGCEKEIRGCTNSNASNYNPDATDDDGSCTLCNGSGSLRLENSSTSNYYKINIDGINYGSLDPGESKDYTLPAGNHSFEFQKLTGPGNGCSSANVIIVACQVQGFYCNG
jgi:hypothetical protein